MLLLLRLQGCTWTLMWTAGGTRPTRLRATTWCFRYTGLQL